VFRFGLLSGLLTCLVVLGFWVLVLDWVFLGGVGFFFGCEFLRYFVYFGC